VARINILGILRKASIIIPLIERIIKVLKGKKIEKNKKRMKDV